MPSISPNSVRLIMDTDLDDPQIVAALEAAEPLVLRLRGLPEATLTQIRIWLAAHFASMLDQRIGSQRAGDASTDFEGQTAMGLDYTRYGQQANLLSEGQLGRMSKLKFAMKAL